MEGSSNKRARISHHWGEILEDEHEILDESNVENEPIRKIIKTSTACAILEIDESNQVRSIYSDGVVIISPNRSYYTSEQWNCRFHTKSQVNALNEILCNICKPMLRKLTIHDCELDLKICPGVEIWTYHLSHLDLSSNNIGPSGLKKLATHIPCMGKLVHLNLSSNRILDEYRCRNRKHGNIDTSGLEALMESIEAHSRLRYVNLTHNFLGGIYDQRTYDLAINRQSLCDRAYPIAEIIAKSLMKNSSIVCFDISDNCFPNDERLAEILLRCIAPLSAMALFEDPSHLYRDEVLSLCGNYTDTSALPMHSFGPSHNEGAVINISFSKKGLVPIDGYFIGEEMRLRSHPYAIDLSDNPSFGDKGISNLVSKLVDSKDDELSAKLPSSSAMDCPPIGMLTPTVNLDPSSRSHHQHQYQQEPALCIRGLNLQDCGISSLGVRALEPLLARNVLEELDLSDNDAIVNMEQIEHIVDRKPFFLHYSTALKRLSIAHSTSKAIEDGISPLIPAIRVSLPCEEYSQLTI
jgi:hypothetical protein